MDVDTRLEQVDIATAAARLGMSLDGVRKRIKRGQLQGGKVDKRWYVVLPVEQTTSTGSLDGLDKPPRQLDRQVDTAERTRDSAEDSASQNVQKLAAILEEEIVFLRRELEARTEELRRKDHIIAALTQRLAPLPSMAQAGEMGNHPAPSENGADSGSQKVSKVSSRAWWQFWR